jgi:hypothetical protein
MAGRNRRCHRAKGVLCRGPFPRGGAFFAPQIDHFVIAITSAEAILWHTTPTNGSNYRMLRVSPLEPQCLNSARAELRGGSWSRLR